MDQQEQKISSKQKGQISENRSAEIITLSSNGNLTCYIPSSDDDGIDLIVNPRNSFKPLFIQVKSRFKLQKTGQFIQNVGIKTFLADQKFWILFVYFNQETLEVEKLWLIPSIEFAKIAYEKKAGKNYKSFYRFSANPFSKSDRWSKYSIEKSKVGEKLLLIIDDIY